MKPIPWYYIYSPKYEIFHHILLSSIGSTDDFLIRPVFVPQEAFSNTYNKNLSHFFSGNTIKVECIINALKVNPDEHIIVSDVDLVVDNISELKAYLEQYKHNDITFMKDTDYDDSLNLGFAFIKSTPNTIHLFETAFQEIKDSKGQDQPIVRQLIQSFKGHHGVFSIPEIIISNLYTVGSKYYVIQLLCSNQDTYESNLFEKLVSAAKLLDITELLPLISEDVLETLRWYFREYYPNHYLSKL